MSQTYLLNRDSDESQRLNDQHELWVKNLGYQISPAIASKLPCDARIADVGTGTGCWLLDLAKDHPSWELHGFDISIAQLQYNNIAPTPPNMHFHLADIKQPFPTDLHGQFDLVHVRLLIFALRAAEWKPAVANLKTLLKPGGWIQWEEIDVDPMQSALRATVGAKATILNGALTSMYSSGGQAIEDSRRGCIFLRDAFYQNELRDVAEDVVSSERVHELRRRATMILVGVMVGLKKQRIAEGGIGAGDLEEVNHLREEIEKEVDRGAYLQFYIHCMIGGI